MRSMLMALFGLAFAGAVQGADLGDDGLHKAPWMRDTFKDLREDMAEAQAEGKHLMVMIEQRGCIYCTKMHEEVWPTPKITQLIEDQFFVVQVNMFGDIEVTDFDGTTLPEKQMVQRWNLLFTPTVMFFGDDAGAIPAQARAPQAAVAIMPGAFGKAATFNMLNWVIERGYDRDEPFQKYHARKVAEQGNQD